MTTLTSLEKIYDSMIYDLHSHTNFSDGMLTPSELIVRAKKMGVSTLAITDHDTISAFKHIKIQNDHSINIVPGIEFSTSWKKINIHILGLNFKLNSTALKEGVRFQEKARSQRAIMISEKLDDIGFKRSLDGALRLAKNENIGRPHFAQHLVNIGAVDNIDQAFRKYLGVGKPGDIKSFWASLPQIIKWIKEAEGTAVLAHPKKYKLTRTKLKHLIDDFILAGGQGLEVVSGNQNPETTKDLAKLCIEKKLLASCGSDFHKPGETWAELGNFAKITSSCIPVWDCW